MAELDKELLKELLIDNPTLNNVGIAKLYNDIKNENNNPEYFRKIVKKARAEFGIGNVGAKHTTKSSNRARTTVYQEENTRKGGYRFCKVDTDKGTLLSEVEISFEPRSHDELAQLHNVDLSVYKISNYWTKLQPDGKFTSSLLCSLRKVGDSITAEDLLESVKKAVSEEVKKVNRISVPKVKVSNNTLILWVSDEHVGASVSGSIYENNYDANEYYRRKMLLLDTVEREAERNGNFEKIIVCSLGDNLDGNSGKTTRTILGDHGHSLPQNMTNSEVISTYVETNKAFYEKLISMGVTNKVCLYNVNNSNHGGLAFDYAANYALEVYLKAVYGNKFEINQLQGIYSYFDLYNYRIVLTHGKDETTMKRNLPLVLNPSIELQLTEYLDEVGRNKKNYHNLIVKGDLHQYSSQLGKYFHYQNIPSLFGSSGWIHANFGRGNAGYCFSVVSENEPNGISFNPVWIK